MNVFYVNRERYQQKDVLVALIKAINLLQKHSNIKTITFLIGQQNNIGLLSGLNFFKMFQNGTGFVTEEGYNVRYRTLKTYKPDYVLQGKEPSEILIPLCVQAVDLYQFEDFTDIAYYIVVPWLLDGYKGYLSIFEAEDCETGTRLAPPPEVDWRVANGIDWLIRNAYPTAGFMGPSDEDLLKNVAVSLKKIGATVNYDGVVYYGIKHGLRPSTARRTADFFVRAQSHSMKIMRKQMGLAQILNAPRDVAK